MIDAKKKAELDQGIAMLVEFYPNQWRGLFVRLLDEGFTESQAMELVKSYILATCANQWR